MYAENNGKTYWQQKRNVCLLEKRKLTRAISYHLYRWTFFPFPFAQPSSPTCFHAGKRNGKHIAEWYAIGSRTFAMFFDYHKCLIEIINLIVEAQNTKYRATTTLRTSSDSASRGAKNIKREKKMKWNDQRLNESDNHVYINIWLIVFALHFVWFAIFFSFSFLFFSFFCCCWCVLIFNFNCFTLVIVLFVLFAFNISIHIWNWRMWMCTQKCVLHCLL